MFNLYALIANGVCTRRASFDTMEDAEMMFDFWSDLLPDATIRMTDECDHLIKVNA